MIVAFDCWNECQSFRGEEFVISPAMSEAVESLLIALVGDSVAEMPKVEKKLFEKPRMTQGTPPEKKCFLSGIDRMGGGGGPCPN